MYEVTKGLVKNRIYTNKDTKRFILLYKGCLLCYWVLRGLLCVTGLRYIVIQDIYVVGY